LSADLEDMLEHLKWNLWHGKVPRALEIVDELVYALDVEDASPEHRKLLKAVRAFEAYVTNNRAAIPNYGERYRKGQIISTAFVKSAVNQVVSRRFVKKQQMRWTPAGAHLLLQIRIEVLNGHWRSTLARIGMPDEANGGIASGLARSPTTLYAPPTTQECVFPAADFAVRSHRNRHYLHSKKPRDQLETKGTLPFIAIDV